MGIEFFHNCRSEENKKLVQKLGDKSFPKEIYGEFFVRPMIVGIKDDNRFKGFLQWNVGLGNGGYFFRMYCDAVNAENSPNIRVFDKEMMNTFKKNSSLSESNYNIYIEKIAVIPQERKKGYGKKLFEETFNRIAHISKEINISPQYIFLDTRSEEASSFWEKLNFVPVYESDLINRVTKEEHCQRTYCYALDK